MQSIAGCRPEWILRWSASCAGPLHTRSKRFDALKDNPDKIGAMLAEIAEYESLSANVDADWRHAAGDATLWLDDYWRVMDAPEPATPGLDRILEARQEEVVEEVVPDAIDDVAIALDLAPGVSLPPGFLQAARLAEDHGSRVARILQDDALPVRLAVYLKLMGAADDAYPAAWCDPATGALSTMQQLAGLAAVSLPTLRKRRDAAIARLIKEPR